MEQSNYKHSQKEISEFTTLPIDRLEQLGYQCRTERCDVYTTITIRPVDGELVKDLALNHQTKEQHN